jgi:type IV secretion system protein VirB2
MTESFEPSIRTVFAAALGWVEGTLLGTVAATVAIIAVASVGFLMVTGRIDVPRAGQVVFGCFVIFGASNIARGIVGMASDASPDL